MKLGKSTAAGSVAAAALVVAFGFSGAASADTISFDGLTAGSHNPYTEKGYTLTNVGVVDPTTAQMSYGPGGALSDDPDPTSATLIVNGLSTTTLNKNDGGAFDLVSIDFAPYLPNFGKWPIDMTFNFVGGTSSTISYALSGLGPVLETLTFNQKNLLSVAMTPTAGTGSLQYDNIVSNVARTPVPAALPLFLTALGGLGFAGWRRRKA